MDTQITEKESLLIIQTMINNAQRKYQEKGELFIMWGWLVFFTSLIHYSLLRFHLVAGQYAWIVWPLMGISGMIFQYRFLKRKKQQEKRTTLYDLAMTYLWSGIGLLYFFILVLALSGRMNWSMAYGLFLGIFGIGNFISGGMLKYKPLIWGGIAGILIGFVTVFASIEYILLLMAAGVVCMDLVPGYMLKKKNSHE